jgi:hypothetical protein
MHQFQLRDIWLDSLIKVMEKANLEIGEKQVWIMAPAE